MSNSAHRGKPRRRPAVIALISLVSVVGIGTAAYAYWTSQGTGTGSATTGEVDSVTVTQTGAPEGLYPGGPAVALAGTIVNDNDSDVTVGALTAVVSDGGNDGCEADDFVIEGTATLGSSLIQENSSTTWTGLTVRLAETGVNQDACQNTEITITYTAAPGA